MGESYRNRDRALGESEWKEESEKTREREKEIHEKLAEWIISIHYDYDIELRVGFGHKCNDLKW